MISHRPATTLRRRGQMKFISYKTHGGAGSSPADDSFSHKILSANFEAQITSKNQENFFFVNLGYVGFKEPEKYFYHLRIFTCIFNFCTVFTARSAKFIKLSSFSFEPTTLIDFFADFGIAKYFYRNSTKAQKRENLNHQKIIMDRDIVISLCDRNSPKKISQKNINSIWLQKIKIRISRTVFPLKQQSDEQLESGEPLLSENKTVRINHYTANVCRIL
jgi:hypothetical protein